MPARTDIDWQLIYFLWRFGNFGFKRIALQTKIPASTIRAHALAHNWSRPAVLPEPLSKPNGSPKTRQNGTRTAATTGEENAVNYFAADPRTIRRALADNESANGSRGPTSD
jgi:hypothetical protein